MYKIYKNKLFYYALLTILAVIFFIGYIVSYDKTKDNSDNKDIMTGIITKQTVDYDIIKITLKSVYTINDQEIIDDTQYKFGESKDELFKLSESELRNMFKKEGYRFKDIVENEIIYTRTLEKYKYEANKYVIGIKNDRVTIFKTDDKGNINVEDGEVDDVKMKDLPKIFKNELKQQDIDYLEMGDAKYQFDSLEEAIDGLKGLFTS